MEDSSYVYRRFKSTFCDTSRCNIWKRTMGKYKRTMFVILTLAQVIFLFYKFNLVSYRKEIYVRNYEQYDHKIFVANSAGLRPVVTAEVENIVDLNNFADRWNWNNTLYFKSSGLQKNLTTIRSQKKITQCKTINGLYNNTNSTWQERPELDMVTQEELAMPIAFSILVYTDFAMLDLLLDSIYKPHNLYCIHIDKKAPSVYKNSVYKLASCYDNVFVARQQYSIVWGDFSIIQAEISCMKELLLKSVTWRYFINLTGQEFPLRTNYELTQILSSLRGQNLVYCTERRINQTRFVGAGPVPLGLKLYKGPTHTVLSRDFVDYLLNDKIANQFIAWLKQVIVPDEHLFQMLHCNAHIDHPGGSLNDSLVLSRFKLWNNKNHFDPISKRGIAVLRQTHFRSMAMSRKLFANKFLIDKYPKIVYQLKTLLQQRSSLEYKGYLEFNTSLYRRK